MWHTRKMFILLAVITLVSCNQMPQMFFNEFIQKVNEKQDLWKAGADFPKDTISEHVKHLTGVISFNRENLEVISHENNETLPENFDAREKWSFCPSLNKVWNQGACGSCWAVVTAEIITDRVCVMSNGSRSFSASVEDLLSCCTECRSDCSGGDPIKAWKYWIKKGIVTGGDYNSNSGCMPYKIKPCHNVFNCTLSDVPVCDKTCVANSNETYVKDKNFGKRYYQVKTENGIQMELLKNGPVEAIMTVYADFFIYKSGIYKHVLGKKRGLHAVKIVGYGTENGTKFWSAVNSWGPNWGEAGFFKIVRGKNECDIEDMVMAAEPLLK